MNACKPPSIPGPNTCCSAVPVGCNLKVNGIRTAGRAGVGGCGCGCGVAQCSKPRSLKSKGTNFSNLYRTSHRRGRSLAGRDRHGGKHYQPGLTEAYCDDDDT